MYFTIRQFTAILVGAAAVTVSVSGMACSLASTDPGQIKPISAREIVHRLDAPVQPVQRQAAFPPGAQRRGPMTLLADMGWSQAGQSVGGPWPRPEPQPRPWPVPSPRPKPWPWPWPDPEKPWPGPGPVPEPMEPQRGAARPWL